MTNPARALRITGASPVSRNRRIAAWISGSLGPRSSDPVDGGGAGSAASVLGSSDRRVAAARSSTARGAGEAHANAAASGAAGMTRRRDERRWDRSSIQKLLLDLEPAA